MVNTQLKKNSFRGDLIRISQIIRWERDAWLDAGSSSPVHCSGGEMLDEMLERCFGEMLIPASSGGEMLWPVCALTQ